MEAHFYGEGARYNDQDYNEILKCMSRDDDLLVKAHESAWKKGFVDLYFK